jgi:hypothetical protein
VRRTTIFVGQIVVVAAQRIPREATAPAPHRSRSTQRCARLRASAAAIQAEDEDADEDADAAAGERSDVGPSVVPVMVAA